MLPRGTSSLPLFSDSAAELAAKMAARRRTVLVDRSAPSRREYLSKRDTIDYLSVVEASINISPDSSRIIRHQIYVAILLKVLIDIDLPWPPPPLCHWRMCIYMAFVDMRAQLSRTMTS